MHSRRKLPKLLTLCYVPYVSIENEFNNNFIIVSHSYHCIIKYFKAADHQNILKNH